MSELEDISYSRDETIRAVRDYHSFLVSMHLPESCILEPPTGGWPNINVEKFRGMGKTDEVIELLRHLPYIRAGNTPFDESKAAPFCQFADYQQFIVEDGTEEDRGETMRVITETPSFMDSVPPHVVGIAGGSEYNPVMLLDTKLGIVHWVECPHAIRYPSRIVVDHNGERLEVDDDDENDPFIKQIDDDPMEYAPENQLDWRMDGATWAIVDFFAVLKRQFRKLNFIPIHEKIVVDVWTDLGEGVDGMVTELQQIWRQHGWPVKAGDDQAGFNKTACLLKLEEVIRTKYPKFAQGQYCWGVWEPL